jgi:RNA polymerase sigma-70 factor (ECF subfamily)
LIGEILKDFAVWRGIGYGKAIAIGRSRRENAFMDIDFEALTIIGAQRGDERAWRNLFEWHFESVYRYCASLSSGRQDMAEEIAQEVFVTAARRINKFKAKKGTFRSWLLGIAKNQFMKLQLKERTRKRYERELSTESSEGTKGGSEEVLVYEALARLPGQYRKVLEAKYLQGLTVNEIAESQGRTAKATESLLSRAREKFGEVYEKMQERSV